MSVYTTYGIEGPCDPDGPAHRDCSCPRCRDIFERAAKIAAFKEIITTAPEEKVEDPQLQKYTFTEDHIGILRDVITMLERDDIVAVTVRL